MSYKKFCYVEPGGKMSYILYPPQIQPFLQTLYKMVDAQSTNNIIRWNVPGEENGFTILDFP